MVKAQKERYVEQYAEGSVATVELCVEIQSKAFTVHLDARGPGNARFDHIDIPGGETQRAEVDADGIEHLVAAIEFALSWAEQEGYEVTRPNVAIG